MDSLYDTLDNYAKKNITPMHMPGHKRNSSLSPCLNHLGIDLDITEIHNMDYLHNPTGILKAAMENAARIYKSFKSYFLINGSTCGILSGIKAAAKYGDKILIGRNCHISVYRAIELLGLSPYYILPEFDKTTGIFLDISPLEIEKAINKHPDTKLIVLTSPTYEGIVSNINKICQIAHSKNIPVLIDEAHGAHFGFNDYFPESAVKLGADITVQSLHKTLPSLTQTAILHLNGNLIEHKKLENSLSVFQTSSPSYLFMASIDNCIRMVKNKPNLFINLKNALINFYEKAKHLKYLSVMDKNNKDKSKIVISTAKANITGQELSCILRNKYQIETEMSSLNYISAMTGLGDTAENIEKLYTALYEIDKNCSAKNNNISITAVLPEKIMNISDALLKDTVDTTIYNCENKVCGEFIWAYPPGIPIIAPGEIFTKEIIENIIIYKNNKITLQNSMGNIETDKVKILHY